jgi:hypothetical protein
MIERDRLIDSLVSDHPELARERTLLVQFLNVKGWAENALQVFEYLNLDRAGGVLARVQDALSMFSFPGLSEVAFIVDTLAMIGEANLYAVRMLGRKAYAYGVTAWAFEHPMPALPAADAAKLRQWSSERRVRVGAGEWARMGEAAMMAMLRRCTENRIRSADFKLLVRMSFQNQPRLLAQAVYQGLQTGMTDFERGAHEALGCDYPA